MRYENGGWHRFVVCGGIVGVGEEKLLLWGEWDRLFIMVRQAVDMIRKIESLPDSEQVVLAQYLSAHLGEVLADARWQQLFEKSPQTLDALGAEVDDAIVHGRVAPLDPDEL
jgi:hypothetical protein